MSNGFVCYRMLVGIYINLLVFTYLYLDLLYFCIFIFYSYMNYLLVKFEYYNITAQFIYFF